MLQDHYALGSRKRYPKSLSFLQNETADAIKRYIKDREVNDQMCDQLSFKEYEDPFKNVADFDEDDSPEIPTDGRISK